MSIDLRLLPCEVWHTPYSHSIPGKLWGYSHSILDLGSVGEEAWAAFQTQVKPHLVDLPAEHDVTAFTGARVPKGNYYEGEAIYGRFRAKDGYGDPYAAITAEHLLPWLAEHFQYDGHLGHGPYHSAIVAYVRALPPNTKIVLDWH